MPKKTKSAIADFYASTVQLVEKTQIIWTNSQAVKASVSVANQVEYIHVKFENMTIATVEMNNNELCF